MSGAHPVIQRFFESSQEMTVFHRRHMELSGDKSNCDMAWLYDYALLHKQQNAFRLSDFSRSWNHPDR